MVNLRKTSLPSPLTRVLYYLVSFSLCLFSPLAQTQTIEPSPSGASLSSLALDTPAENKALETLARVRQLVKAGVTRLALNELQQDNAPSIVNATWKAWYEQKWSLFEQLNDYAGLLADIRQLPPVTLNQVTSFVKPYEALALIHLGEQTKAIHLLQSILVDQRATADDRKRARHNLIKLYSESGDYLNAQIDATRYHSEFKPQDVNWFIERAIIEHLAGRTESAAQILAPINAIDAKLLQIYFRFKIANINGVQAGQQLQKQLQRKRISKQQKKLAYAIAAEVYSSTSTIKALEGRASSLEQYHHIDTDDLYPEVVSHKGQSLNQTYRSLSTALVNQAGLLGSNKGQWYSLAQKLEEQENWQQAKALYTQVLQDKSNSVLRSAALNHFVKILLKGDNVPILNHLFGDGADSIGDLSELDSQYSALVLNYALEQSNADLIALIAPYLGDAPPSVKLEDWLLQKARIDIFAGRFEQGKQKLESWINAYPVLNGSQVDKILQPVYDLQAANQDELSLALFDLISDKTQSKRHKREILFWKAQSHANMGERLRAASLYLESALVQDNGFDEWGQSARYHAASTLMEAAYYEDAKRLFEGLLLATKDSARLTTIKQALQRLWLLENNSVKG